MAPSEAGKKEIQLRINLFGQFRLVLDSDPIQLPTRKSEVLLAYLVLHPGRHGREKLAALFWGDSSDVGARNSLRNALALLNKTVGTGLVLADRQTVEINPDYPYWVDAFELQEKAFTLQTEPLTEHAEIISDLYKGDLLSDFYDDWIFPLRDQYRSLLIDSLLLMAQQQRSQSEYESAIDYASQVLAFDAANERAHQHVIFSFMAQGKRSAALQQFERCEAALWEELAVEPSEATLALVDWIRQGTEEQKPFAAQITNLVLPLTSFIGRKRSMVEIKQQLASTRLTTITGSAGGGKTRIAFQVGADLLDAFPDGVWWVELASLTDETLVPQRIARSVGVTEVHNVPLLETISNFLRSKHLLLILDNCEHLIEACAQSAQALLEASPRLTIIATSREALNIPGEKVWPVPALSLPELESAPPVEQLMDYEAVELFVERAAAVRADYMLTEQNASAVTQICSTLDGIPLAIELAAAWVGALSTAQIASRLDDSLRLLRRGSRTALPRHQTLQAAIDWSYDLLSGQERTLFRRLAVFSGGWTLEAAEKICAGGEISGGQVLTLLTNLVDKSLVVREKDAGVSSRYRFLETIRQYADDALTREQEEAEVRHRHLEFYAQLVGSASPHLGFFLPDMEMVHWMQVLEPEQDNLRKVLKISLEDPSMVEFGLRIAGNLHWFWLMLSQFAEGRDWLEQLLANSASVPLPLRSLGHLTAGFLACWQGSFASAKVNLEQSLAGYRQLEDRSGTAFSLHGLGFAANGVGDHARAGELFKESVDLAREIDDKWLTSFALHFLAIGTSFQGALEQAQAMFEENIQINQSGYGNAQGIGFSLFHLGRIARLQGRYDLAVQHHREGLALFAQIADRRGLGYMLAGLACLAFAQEELEQAAYLFGVVDAIRGSLGNLLEEILQAEYEHAKAAAQQILAEEDYQITYQRGKSAALEQVIQGVLGEEMA